MNLQQEFAYRVSVPGKKNKTQDAGRIIQLETLYKSCFTENKLRS
jgi:hypothetical protein